MNIGERIRELRVSKLMTQSELAGNQITRNMLSCIENGSANPSLSTILYIAGKLNVPAGFLLAEEGDEIVYRKMSNLPNIKRAYSERDLWGCRSLCISTCPDPDDEICLLLANCDVGIAIEEFWNGKLRSACRFFDEALRYTEKTIYPTETIEAEARIYFRYMERISHTLYSDMLDEEKTMQICSTSAFASYLGAIEALDEENNEIVESFLKFADPDSFFFSHIHIRSMMMQKDFKSAQKALLHLLNAETPLNKIELYNVLCELEICCREIDDFKGAYNYANDKLTLLEQLLSEI